MKSKSLEQLENNVWGHVPDNSSNLVRTCHALRKKKIEDYSTEDYRILIGQGIGLKYLVPLALEILSRDILAEGDYYPGDLLKSVLSCDKEFWEANLGLLLELLRLVGANRLQLESADLRSDVKDSIFQDYKGLLELKRMSMKNYSYVMETEGFEALKTAVNQGLLSFHTAAASFKDEMIFVYNGIENQDR